MTRTIDRRQFLETSVRVAAGLSLAACAHPQASETSAQPPQASQANANPWFQISLAEWSFHKALFAGQMNHLDFAKVAKTEFGIDAVEYVNQFFKDKAKDEQYLSEMKRRCADLGVESRLIMIDDEGDLGDADSAARTKAVENHYKWVEAAKYLGCFAIRVNARSTGSFDEQMKLAADGLRRLSEFGRQHR